MPKLILLSSIIATVLIASTPPDPTPTTPSRWIPVARSPNGFTVWSTRNFQVVSVRDKFTFELRTAFVEGTGADIAGKELASIETTVEASCVNKTGQIIADKSI